MAQLLITFEGTTELRAEKKEEKRGQSQTLTRIPIGYIPWHGGRTVANRGLGTIYNVLSRGHRREAIFRIEAGRKLFLDCWARPAGRTGRRIRAHCLMDNHFHLVVETPRGNLRTALQWFIGSYTQKFNRRDGLFPIFLAAVTHH